MWTWQTSADLYDFIKTTSCKKPSSCFDGDLPLVNIESLKSKLKPCGVLVFWWRHCPEEQKSGYKLLSADRETFARVALMEPLLKSSKTIQDSCATS